MGGTLRAMVQDKGQGLECPKIFGERCLRYERCPLSALDQFLESGVRVSVCVRKSEGCPIGPAVCSQKQQAPNAKSVEA